MEFAWLVVVYSFSFLSWFWNLFTAALVRFDACVCKMARGMGCAIALGLLKSYASAICLPGFLVGRNGCFCGLESFRRFGGHFAFDEIAFLLLVLLVGAGVDVLDAFHQNLVGSGLLVGDLRLLIEVVAFQDGCRNLGSK